MWAWECGLTNLTVPRQPSSTHTAGNFVNMDAWKTILLHITNHRGKWSVFGAIWQEAGLIAATLDDIEQKQTFISHSHLLRPSHILISYPPLCWFLSIVVGVWIKLWTSDWLCQSICHNEFNKVSYVLCLWMGRTSFNWMFRFIPPLLYCPSFTPPKPNTPDDYFLLLLFFHGLILRSEWRAERSADHRI